MPTSITHTSEEQEQLFIALNDVIRPGSQNISRGIFTSGNNHYPDAGIFCGINIVQAVTDKNAGIPAYSQFSERKL